MDRFFVSFLLLDEGAMIALSFLLIVAGGVATAFLTKVQFPLRRVSYFCSIAALGLMLSLSQISWAMVPAAADGGFLSLIVIAGFGFFALFGAGIYYVSAARSIHITGDTGKAWMGFVPLANLWLMLKGGGSHGVEAEKTSRSAVSRLALDPFLVLCGFLVLAFSQGVDKILEDSPLFRISDSQTLTNLISEAQTLEERFATEAMMSQREMPVRADEMTVMTSVEAEGTTLRITYQVEREVEGFRPDFKQTLADMQCAPDMFGNEIAKGGTVEILYLAPSGRTIELYEITQVDCVS